MRISDWSSDVCSSDLDFARLEQEGVFGRSWLMVAHGDELRNPGDYRLVDQLPQPIMLVRGQDGVIRAHHNTCKHRGAMLLSEPCGNTGRRMVCPYHSWVYDLDGNLVGYPDEANFREQIGRASCRERVGQYV